MDIKKIIHSHLDAFFVWQAYHKKRSNKTAYYLNSKKEITDIEYDIYDKYYMGLRKIYGKYDFYG